MSEYPMTFEEFEKNAFELYLKQYPDDKREMVLGKLELLLGVEGFMKRLYEHTCVRYNRSNLSDNRRDISDFESLTAITMNWYIGGEFDSTSDMSDLKKVERNFHILIKDLFLNEKCIGDYDYRLPELSEDSFGREEFHRVPGMYGGFFYSLKLEDGKPILYANASSRMDLDELYIVDDVCYRWNGDYY